MDGVISTQRVHMVRPGTPRNFPPGVGPTTDLEMADASEDTQLTKAPKQIPVLSTLKSLLVLV